MEKTQIGLMVNGLPGKMAWRVVELALEDSRFRLVPYSLTGPEITEQTVTVDGQEIALIRPDQRIEAIAAMGYSQGKFICADFTLPDAVIPNARLYRAHGFPFVMGTTGGDREELNTIVETSDISAVIAQNMAKPIVGFLAMMQFAAENFPGLFAGYSLIIRESHQQGKADTSGTAKVMGKFFNKLGAKFTEEQIVSVRDPEFQEKSLGVPKEHLGGHGWHTYKLTSPDGTVGFEFVHNVNGRDVYALGALDAVAFLDNKMKQGARGHAFTMVDVLKGQRG